MIITDTTTNCVSPSASGTVTVNPNPTVTVNSPAVCAGASATVTATPGAAGTYSYAWTVPTGATAPGDVATFNTTVAGVYSVIITDTVTGCVSTSASGTVTINPNPTVTVNSPTVCDGASATVTATPGVAGTYSYAWTVPAAATAPGDVATFTTTIAGVYSVIITDTVTGCVSTSASGTVSLSTNPTVTVNSQAVCQGTPATVTATPGAAGTYNYTWSVPAGFTNPGNVATFTTTVAGVYSVIITDTTTNCVSPSASGTVTVNPNPTVTVNSPAVCAGASATVTATPGAAGTYSYAWTVPTGATAPGDVATFNTTVAGVYSVIITNTVTGCVSTSASGTVTINPNPTVTVNSPAVCAGASATVTATSGTAGTYSYAWTVPTGAANPGNVATFTTAIAGVYSVIITNTTTGCISTSASGTVTVNPNPTVSVNSATVCTGTIVTMTATPGTAGTYSYAWTVPSGVANPGNVASFTTTTAGTYSVVITNTVTNCVSVSASGTITLLPLPTATIAGNITICPTAEATVTFTGTPNTTVEYSVNGSGIQTLLLDAAGVGVIVDTYNTTTTYTLLGVFTSGTPVCSVSLNESITITVAPAPTINTPADLILCDDNNDGVQTFNLAQYTTFITGGNPNVTLTYHETLVDAQLGGAPIPNPSNYQSIVPGAPSVQTIYVRVVNTGTTDCPSITTFNLFVNPFPVINLTPTAYELCDDNTDGEQVFDLTTRISNILNGLDSSLHTVTFHQTDLEAQAGTPIITGANAYLSPTQTIWVRVVINATGCFAIAPLDLIVNPLPQANLPTPLTLCDDNNPGDQVEEFDLTQAISEIVGSQMGMQVTFHLTLAQAQAGTNVLNTTYTNVTPAVQTLHVRVLNPITGCWSTTTLDIRVVPLPLPLVPLNPITLCDDNNDGLASFDLQAQVPGLLNGATDVDLTFHETEQQAIDGTNAIDISTPYLTINAGTQFIYVRAVNTTTGCVRVVVIELRVNPRPEVPTTLDDLRQCDTHNNPLDGLSQFNLTVQTPIILAAQTGAANQYSVRYFTTEANAISNTGAIVNTNAFPNTVNPQTIWVRVTHIATGCFDVGSFALIVDTPLALTVPTPISLCDEALPNNQFTVFDLTVRNNEITNNLGGYTVTYYPSYQNALDNVNAIQNPSAYTNAIAAVQTLGVRVTSAAGCHSYTTLTIRVIPLPEPRTNPEPIEACDDNNPGDGIEAFDLTIRANYILNGASSTEFSLAYYVSEADAIAETNAIANPTAFNNTIAVTQTIWVRVTREPNNVNEPRCYQLVQLQLIVNPLPVIAASPINFYQCEPIDDYQMPFVLSTMNPQVLGATQLPSDYTVSYYFSAADAASGTSPLPNVYTNISSPQTIYVRVENNQTGCVNATGEVILEVEEGTQANTIAPSDPLITQCDQTGANDGIGQFDLTQLTPILLGSNNPTGTVVYYFTTLAQAQAAILSNDYTTAIANAAAYQNVTPMVETMYAVLVNPATVSNCPTLVPIVLTVNKLPEPTPQPGTLCVDPQTGDLLNTYTLTSNLSGTTHTFVWTDSTGTILGTAPNLTVDTPGSYTVVATNIATQCVSLPVTTLVVQSQQATLSYTQSNYFSNSATITIIATGTSIPDQGNSNYVYSLDYGPFQTSNVFTNVSAGLHIVTVQDLNGCSDATIEVFVVDYPKFFTPNGDGINDTWNIFSLGETQPNAKIYIFDRYGKFIKQISPAGNGWNGTYNGEQLPSTDYWFSVEYQENGQNKVFKAHFSLKR
ncbi:T9SS type B sorting domain-containing protein [Flavobacterium filum]|uniref:T9SS type B sorting domain-containing protein n=1 Tax=Flavobacterium filum TaxID=370974 RepID=UPI0023F10781|nr:T9SS type B sorting domain-containing protein [Flavobacterium filum]